MSDIDDFKSYLESHPTGVFALGGILGGGN